MNEDSKVTYEFAKSMMKLLQAYNDVSIHVVFLSRILSNIYGFKDEDIT